MGPEMRLGLGMGLGLGLGMGMILGLGVGMDLGLGVGLAMRLRLGLGLGLRQRLGLGMGMVLVLEQGVGLRVGLGVGLGVGMVMGWGWAETLSAVLSHQVVQWRSPAPCRAALHVPGLLRRSERWHSALLELLIAPISSPHPAPICGCRTAPFISGVSRGWSVCSGASAVCPSPCIPRRAACAAGWGCTRACKVLGAWKWLEKCSLLLLQSEERSSCWSEWALH